MSKRKSLNIQELKFSYPIKKEYRIKCFDITILLYICSINEDREDMKWSELRRKAAKRGWYLVRNGKEHDLYAHPDRDFEIQISRHDSEEVKPGLYHKLKKQIGF